MLTEVFSKGLIAFLGNEINIEIAATVATVLAILMLLAQASKSGVASFFAHQTFVFAIGLAAVKGDIAYIALFVVLILWLEANSKQNADDECKIVEDEYGYRRSLSPTELLLTVEIGGMLLIIGFADGVKVAKTVWNKDVLMLTVFLFISLAIYAKSSKIFGFVASLGLLGVLGVISVAGGSAFYVLPLVMFGIFFIAPSRESIEKLMGLCLGEDKNSKELAMLEKGFSKAAKPNVLKVAASHSAKQTRAVFKAAADGASFVRQETLDTVIDDLASNEPEIDYS